MTKEVMNERIKELEILCRIGEYNEFGDVVEVGFDTEKFAELIVKECIYVISESREVRQTAYYYRNRLAEHFGVTHG